MIVCCSFLRSNWLRNMWKEKLRKNVTRQYLSPECVVWSLNIVVVVSKKPFKWPQRREGSNGAVVCFCGLILHAEALIVQRGKNFRWSCYFNTVITKKGSLNTEMYSCRVSEHNLFSENCVFLFIHSFRLSFPWNPPRNSPKKDSVHWLSSCTFQCLSSLSWLSLYSNNSFIENSFRVVLSKLQRVKLTRKSKRRRHWNLPFSEVIWRVSSKQPQQYSSSIPHTLAVSIDEWHFYAAFLFTYFLTNCPLGPVYKEVG